MIVNIRILSVLLALAMAFSVTSVSICTVSAEDLKVHANVAYGRGDTAKFNCSYNGDGWDIRNIFLERGTWGETRLRNSNSPFYMMFDLGLKCEINEFYIIFAHYVTSSISVTEFYLTNDDDLYDNTKYYDEGWQLASPNQVLDGTIDLRFENELDDEYRYVMVRIVEHLGWGNFPISEISIDGYRPYIHTESINSISGINNPRIGHTGTANAEVLPIFADEKAVTWESSDEDILSINSTTGYWEAKSIGEVTITATTVDGGITNYVTVFVVSNYSLIGLDITSFPKTDYIEGQTFDPEGIEVSAVFSDGTSLALLNYLYEVETKVLSVGDEFILVKFLEMTEEIPITVNPRLVTKIELEKNPNKMVYNIGQKFNMDGMIIKAYYDNGTTEVVTGYSFSPAYFEQSGKKTEVTISYQNESITIDVEVTSTTLTEIKLVQAPDKTEYFEDDYFMPDGIIVMAYFDDDTEEEIDNYNIDITEPLTTSDTQITLSYVGHSIIIDITVTALEISDVMLYSEPLKSEYLIGESLDLTGGALTLIYNNGKVEIIDITDDMITGFNNKQQGIQIITVVYSGTSVTFSITVTGEIIKRKKGFITNDGNNDDVTIADAIAIFRHLADKVKITDKDVIWAADIDGKDNITIQDAIYIFRYLADKLTMDELQGLHLENSITKIV